MKGYKQVEGSADLLRTPSGNIINTNLRALQKAKLKKKKELDQTNKINTLEDEVKTIKEQLDKIIGILSKDENH